MGTGFISAFVLPVINVLVFSVLPSFKPPAPSCIRIYTQTNNSLTLINNCKSEQTVNIKIPFAFEQRGNKGGNRCITLPPGSIYWTSWRVGKFDRLESCRFKLW